MLAAAPDSSYLWLSGRLSNHMVNDLNLVVSFQKEDSGQIRKTNIINASPRPLPPRCFFLRCLSLCSSFTDMKPVCTIPLSLTLSFFPVISYCHLHFSFRRVRYEQGTGIFKNTTKIKLESSKDTKEGAPQADWEKDKASFLGRFRTESRIFRTGLDN